MRDQVPLIEIAERLSISRNIVRRYLRSETTELAYVERQSASAIDLYNFQLSTWLKMKVAKFREQRGTLDCFTRTYGVLGFKESYDRVVAFVKQSREDQPSRSVQRAN